jgi:6-phosphogluconate dehydrogenase
MTTVGTVRAAARPWPRSHGLTSHGIDLVDVGVSGGIWGRDHGYALMFGGPERAVAGLAPVLQALRPADGGLVHAGSSGAGHFAKMIPLEDDEELARLRGHVDDSGEGRWTVEHAVSAATPAPAITAALYARFASRQEDPLAMRVLAALCREFGGDQGRS